MGRRPSADRGTHVGGWWLSLLVGMLAVPPVADAQQVVGISVGQFSVVSESSRSTEDVLRANRSFQTFDIGDFDNIVVGGDWMLAFSDYVEAGAGLEFYQRSVSGTPPVDEATTGSSLAVDMTVRTVSVPITARLFPLTRNARVQPDVGDGATIHFWRYTEERVLTVGSFSGQSSAIDQGITAGPVVFGGVRVPVGAVNIGGEVRYRASDARLNGPVFEGTTLNLGGSARAPRSSSASRSPAAKQSEYGHIRVVRRGGAVGRRERQTGDGTSIVRRQGARQCAPRGRRVGHSGSPRNGRVGFGAQPRLEEVVSGWQGATREQAGGRPARPGEGDRESNAARRTPRQETY